MYLQKVRSKKTVTNFVVVDVLKVINENSRIRNTDYRYQYGLDKQAGAL